jgi:hypothetical protein
MVEAVRTSETSVDNHFTRRYNPEDSSEHHAAIIMCFSFKLGVVQCAMPRFAMQLQHGASKLFHRSTRIMGVSVSKLSFSLPQGGDITSRLDQVDC